ncbi:hypothetical protein MyNCGM121_22980 [Achromobacter xylosoxidans]
MKRIPTLTKLGETRNATRWLAKFPNTRNTIGPSYHVTTYPRSDLVFIETWVQRRQVNGTRIKAAIQDAVKQMERGQ